MNTAQLLKSLNEKVKANAMDMKFNMVLDKVYKGMADNIAGGFLMKVNVERDDFEDKNHKDYQSDLQASEKLMKYLREEGFEIMHYTQWDDDQDFFYTVYLT